ncbi:hypothetical protein BDN70DRAFT_249165 [Pholiota conissans]|uniref:Heterokaryon incompatibility domain-containing protein n=1 Tax=Pholiota conissans TaxID=109636 RepID=A0A9P5YX25_9AGAR|nr:hypothetical protein BDN70DRAFT_249165 [Pholiota conissans]
METTSSSGAVSALAHELLRAMHKFILPLIQTSAEPIPMSDAKYVSLGTSTDAKEFISALEKFISDLISQSQSKARKEHSIEVTLINGAPQDLKTSINVEKEDGASQYEMDSNTLMPARSMNLGPSPGVIQHPHSNTVHSDFIPIDDVRLEHLQRHLPQTIPIRLVCFEKYDSKLKILLLEKKDIPAYLAHRLSSKKYGKQTAHYFNGIRYFNARAFIKYSILSHTWTNTPGELTYRDWNAGQIDAEDPRCQKLINFCNTTLEDYGFAFGWIDTLCINKDSSAELDESIRSMYSWYANAEVCITYLANSDTISDMENDPWFKRGWTFQELVASRRIKFYNRHWKQINSSSTSNTDDKTDLSVLSAIQRATTITPKEMVNIRGASISRRMQLASKRIVTREEDAAYCLMGIFDVSISTEYGEGVHRAFFRLVREIFDSTKDVSDIFNWGGSHSPSWTPITSLFPTSLLNYRSPSAQLRSWRFIEPLTLTHLGLRTPMLLMPAVSTTESVSGPIGDYFAAVSVDLDEMQNHALSGFEIPRTHLILQQRIVEPMDPRTGFLRIRQITWGFGTLNVEEHDEDSIRIPKKCFAVLFEQHGKGVEPPPSVVYIRLYTKEPIFFDLEKSGHDQEPDDEDYGYYVVKREELAHHGMELTTLYL